ncbi:hypothetical protein D9M68_992720 [compost metagenome]
MVVSGDDECFAGGEVSVKCADSDACFFGDGGWGGVDSLVSEDARGDLEEVFAIL